MILFKLFFFISEIIWLSRAMNDQEQRESSLRKCDYQFTRPGVVYIEEEPQIIRCILIE